MKHGLLALIVLLLAGAAIYIFVGRDRQTSSDPDVAAQVDRVSMQTAFGEVPADATQSKTTQGNDRSPDRASGIRHSPAVLPHNKIDAGGTGAETGPRPLTQENEQRLQSFAGELASDSATFRDYLDLSEREARDPDWSDRVERLILESILRNGARFTTLQMSRPYCSQTICTLTATGGLNTQEASSDWQRLMSLVMNEPWFRQYFVDAVSHVKMDQAGAMYIMFFIRKP